MKFSAMKRGAIPLCLLWVLCGSAWSSFALDREAFTITDYDLKVQLDPAQHRLGVRGKITLRNDSAEPQKVAVLQISSSLAWRAIKVGDKPAQFITQPFASDIDHTGALSEAIVTLAQPVAPKGTVELEIGYEGVVLLDATRLTRIGTPEDAAKSTDWDEISTDFTGLRGVGYVAWYPIATEAANLSEGDSLFEVLGRWKKREAGSKMRLQIAMTGKYEALPQILFSGASCPVSAFESTSAPNQNIAAECDYQALRLDVPALAIADYGVLEKPAMEVRYLAGNGRFATGYGDEAEKVLPLITEWFGAPGAKAETADLPNTKAAPFESSALLLTPLANTDSKVAGLAAAHQLTHAAFSSPRPWINEGLAHFAQALYLEHEKGRQTALDYMGLHRSAFSGAEKTASAPGFADEVSRSLVNTASEELYRSKAMYVWWMLRDMIGEAALKKTLAAYRSEDDKDPSYMQRLAAAQTQRNLQWFFDDWVYHDRGLPDFKVSSAYATKTTADSFLVTVTVENLGSAGAEVPMVVRSAGGEVTKRLEIRGKSKVTTRVETPAAPQEIVINDGSVPESDMTNNVFKFAPADK